MHQQSYYELARCGKTLLRLRQPEIADVVYLIAQIAERPDMVERLAGIRAAALKELAPPPDLEEPPLLQFLRQYAAEKEAESRNTVVKLK